MAQWKLTPRVGVSAVCSPLEVGANRAPGAVSDLASILVADGCDVVAVEPVGDARAAVAAGRRLAEAHVDAVALAAASWFEDYLVADLLEECPVPALVWSLPGMETGALCGAQQLGWLLRELGHPYHGVFGTVAEGPACRAAAAFLRGAALHRRLRRARIGLAGQRVNGMTESAVNELAMRRTLGPRIVALDVPALLARVREAPEADARALWQRVVAAAGSCQVGWEAGLQAMRFHLAVEEAVARHDLGALAVGCYPQLMGLPCLSASLLADEGVPLACEGDANAAVAQLALTLLSGQPTHNTDFLEPLDESSIIFTHCGSGSFSLAGRPEEVTLNSVRLMGQGACALFPARPGPVTLVNLVPSGAGYRCAVLEGEALPTEMVFPGNPLRVRFAQPCAAIIQWVHERGLGHHWAAGYGHWAAELRHWAACCRGLVLVEL